MKILEIISKNNSSIEETASSGSTSSGSIASTTSPGFGGPMMPVIKRMEPGQSFFAPAEYQKKQKKKKKQPKK